MRPSLLVPLLLAAACGPSSSEDTGEPVTTAATSTGEGSTATSSPMTTSATHETDPTPTTGTPEPATTTTSTTASTTTDPVETTGEPGTGETTASTTGDTATDSSTGPGEDVQYAAIFWAGGLDHISIFEADFANDRCTGLHLARPYDGTPDFPISLPPEWGVQHGERGPGTAGCLEGMAIGLDEFASAGVGSVTWDPDPNVFCPLELDVDVTLEFGTPEQLQQMAVAVQGCQ